MQCLHLEERVERKKMKKKMKRKRSYSNNEGESRSSKEEDIVTGIDSDSDSDTDKTATPLRPIFCLKKIVDLERFDEKEDCYLLDFDPFHSPLNLSRSVAKDDRSDSELSLLAEKGQVACRDYPHARYLCLKFPFQTSPHETHCDLCYCYACDAKAPCDHWTTHCHASHTDLFWKLERRTKTKTSNTTSPLLF